MNGSNTVSKDDVDSWTTEFHQNYPVLMDDGGGKQGGGIHNKIWQGWDTNGTIGLPFNLIVDRKTMQVKGHLTTPTYAGAEALCDQ